MKKILSLTGLLFCSLLLSAQLSTEHNLALQYYNEGEYEKAVTFLEKLYNKNPDNNLYYRYYYNSLLQLKNFQVLEKLLKKNIKSHPAELTYLVDNGNMLKAKGDTKAADAEYSKAIKQLPPDQSMITKVANAFLAFDETDYAIKTYSAGQQIFKNPFVFSYDLALLFDKKGDLKQAINYYLNHVASKPDHVQTVQNRMQESLQTPEVFNEFKNQLLTRIQDANASLIYSDLLIWAFIQSKDFKSAFIQTRAIDKRFNENGHRVMNLARSATAEKQYDAAIECYQYVIEKGRSNPNFQIARQELLNVRKDKITQSRNYTVDDLKALNNDYYELVKDFGWNRMTATSRIEQAKLQAFYLHQLDSAILMAESVVNFPQADKQLRGNAKLLLGDFYLLSGDVYEPVLLYTQVEKEYKDQPLAELGRFKNAQLSFYKGDFEWAQAQLTILKSATSELVANDALELSVFIMDNLGLDTTAYPMEMYAKASLLYYQNKKELALATLDSIIDIYPNHALTDDILFFKAKTYLDFKQDSVAAKYLGKIIAFHKEDILADDALFLLAGLYESTLNDKEKAKELYEDLIMNHKESVYATEARKRYRALRGDNGFQELSKEELFFRGIKP